MGAPRFLSIDTETTGLDPERDRVIEVAWAIFDDGRLVSTHESLVFPARPLPPAVTRLTGITMPLLARAPRFERVALELVNAVRSVDMVVAYNAAFDRAFLVRELARVGHALPDVPFVDPLQLVRALDDDEPHTLGAVAERYGIDTGADHRALPDALAAGMILLRLLPRIEADTVDAIVAAQRELISARRARKRAARGG